MVTIDGQQYSLDESDHERLTQGELVFTNSHATFKSFGRLRYYCPLGTSDSVLQQQEVWTCYPVSVIGSGGVEVITAHRWVDVPTESNLG